jgi:hypothetical protein
VPHVYFGACAIEPRHGRFKLCRMCLRRRAKCAQRISIRMQQLDLRILWNLDRQAQVSAASGVNRAGQVDRARLYVGSLGRRRSVVVLVRLVDDRPVVGGVRNTVRWAPARWTARPRRRGSRVLPAACHPQLGHRSALAIANTLSTRIGTSCTIRHLEAGIQACPTGGFEPSSARRCQTAAAPIAGSADVLPSRPVRAC